VVLKVKPMQRRNKQQDENDIVATVMSTTKKMPTTKKKTTWKGSKARDLLEKDLISGDIPLDVDVMDAKEVYLQRPEFANFEYAQFRERLRYLRNQIKEKKDSATSASAALSRDRQIYPKASHNHRGEPRWEGSEMERLLRLDMDDGKDKSLKPIDLYQSRKEYSENYTLSVFRKHIDQEQRRRKMLAYYATKNNNTNS
jgi:hypothetical protein